jgi:hypothetical protein
MVPLPGRAGSPPAGREGRVMQRTVALVDERRLNRPYEPDNE